jgi:hypothetical protein
MVGRKVLVAGSEATLVPGENVSGAVELTLPVSNLAVTGFDDAGQLVKKINLGGLPAGFAQFAWEGTDESGTALPPRLLPMVRPCRYVDPGAGGKCDLTTRRQSAIESDRCWQHRYFRN